MLDLLKQIWDIYLPNSDLLQLFRMSSGSASLFLLALLWWSAISPGQIEQTWTRRDFITNRILLFGKAVFCTVVFLYFLGSGALEISRAGTPVKLILANVGVSGLFFFISLEEIHWRVHYWRKKYVYKVENIQLLADRGQYEDAKLAMARTQHVTEREWSRR